MPDDQMILGQHLASRGDPQSWYVGAFVERMAAEILADPQAHIDALVEAGVLKERGLYSPPMGVALALHLYTVVQPHEHDWYAAGQSITEGTRTVQLRCNDTKCRETRTVPNRLPIEVPDA